MIYGKFRKGGDVVESSSCSFTGHRVIDVRHKDKIDDLLDRAIAYAYSVGVRTFYSGGAVGFDTLAARAVVKFRLMHPDVSLVMLLPCADQDSKWTQRQQSNYQYILSVANEVVYLSDGYYRGCMHVRNRELVERADMVIAYCSGRPGGSSHTLKLATKCKKTVYNLFGALERSDV